jgi:hypothetical protein
LEALSINRGWQASIMASQVFVHVQALEHLSRLRLWNCPWVTDGAVSSLSLLHCLLDLTIVGCAVTGNGLKRLRLAQLERFHVELDHALDNTIDALATNLPGLRSLRLQEGHYTHIGNDGLVSLARLPFLSELFLEDWELGLPRICAPILQSFSVTMPPVHSFHFLATPRLVSLSLEDCSVRSLDGIERLGALEQVRLDDCGLADGLAPLSLLPRLRVLDMPRSGVMTLAELRSPSLEELDVFGCSLLREIDASGLPGLRKLTADGVGSELGLARNFLGIWDCFKLESLVWSREDAAEVERLTDRLPRLAHVTWQEGSEVRTWNK